jgi:hypothetical protein
MKQKLPLTYKIRQALPDVFSNGCKECFGRKGRIEWSFDNYQKVDDPPASSTYNLTMRYGVGHIASPGYGFLRSLFISRQFW